MTFVQPPIVELSLIGVAEPGVANEERVILRPTEAVELKQFGIILGVFDPNTGGAKPVFDNVFWFPEMIVDPPAWIMVYTGRGNLTEGILPSGDRFVTLFWQRPYTMFDDPSFVPLLFHMDAVVVGRSLR